MLQRQQIVDEHVLQADFVYTFDRPVRELRVESTLETVTTPGHVHHVRTEISGETFQALLTPQNRGATFLVGGITIGHIRRGAGQNCMIGYWMGERHAGHGHMFAALKLAIPYIFSSLELHRIEAACIPENSRSIRLLEKAGFEREGYLRQYLRINGKWRDHVLFSLLSDDAVPNRKLPL